MTYFALLLYMFHAINTCLLMTQLCITYIKVYIVLIM